MSLTRVDRSELVEARVWIAGHAGTDVIHQNRADLVALRVDQKSSGLMRPEQSRGAGWLRAEFSNPQTSADGRCARRIFKRHVGDGERQSVGGISDDARSGLKSAIA